MKRKSLTLIIFLAFVLMLKMNLSDLQGQVTTQIEGLDNHYCPTASDVTFITIPPGGVASGPGVTGNIFSPVNAGVGEHTIVYEVDTIVYSIQINTGTYLFPFIGNTISLKDDQVSDAIDIGFEFEYFGDIYDSIYISSNGFLAFDSAGGDVHIVQELPDPEEANNIIAFAWNDLIPGKGNGITYYTYGTSPNRIFVVSFDSIPSYDIGAYVTAQIQLYESSNIIEIHVENITMGELKGTMGIENKDGTLSYAVEGRNAVKGWESVDETVVFTPINFEGETETTIVVGDIEEALVMSQTNVVFTEAFAGYTSMIPLLLSNIGCETISIDSVVRNTTEFNYYNSTSSIEIDDTITLNLYFRTNVVGDFSDTIKIYTSAVDTFVIVSGTATEPPEISISIDTFLYDTVNACDATLENTFWIRNSGVTDLSFDTYASTESDTSQDVFVEWFIVSPSEGTVSPDDSTEITISYNVNGLKAGANERTLIIESNDPVNNMFNIDINIFIDIAPELELSSSAYDFGSQFVNGKYYDTLLITNGNCADITFESIVISGDMFSIINEIPDSLEANTSDTIVIMYSPTIVQSNEGTIKFNFGESVETVTLNGEGTAAPVLQYTNAIIYDTLLSCEGEISKDIYINNTGGNPLEYSAYLMLYDLYSSKDTYTNSGSTTKHTYEVIQEIPKLKIRVTINGDFNNTNEIARVYAEGTLLGEMPNGFSDVDLVKTFVICDEMLANMLEDGTIVITVKNSASVDVVGTNNYHIVDFFVDYYDSDLGTGSIESLGTDTLSYNIDLSAFKSEEITGGVFIESNDPLAYNDTIQMLIYKDGEPEISPFDDCVDFGVLETGVAAQRQFEVSNIGCDTLKITNITATENLEKYMPVKRIPSGEQGEVSVGINPEIDSTYSSDTIYFESNAGDFAVCFTYVASSNPAVCSLSKDLIEIEIACENTGSDSFIIKNNGEVDLEYEITIEGSVTDVISLSEFEGVLSQGDSSKIDIAVGDDNLLAGSYTGFIIIANNGSESGYDTINITVNDNYVFVEPLTLTYGETTFCNGEKTTIEANSGFRFEYLWNTGSEEQSIDVESSGLYILDVTDYNGCEFSDSVEITVLTPDLDLGDDIAIADTDSVTLDAGNFISYLWNTNDTTQTIVVNGSETGIGAFTYSVVVSDTFGCMASDSVIVTVEEYIPISIEQLSADLLVMYPNPATKNVTIELSSAAENISLSLLTIDNRVLYRQQLTKVLEDSKILLNLSGYASGVYFIVVDADGKRITNKLIIE